MVSAGVTLCQELQGSSLGIVHSVEGHTSTGIHHKDNLPPELTGHSEGKWGMVNQCMGRKRGKGASPVLQPSWPFV